MINCIYAEQFLQNGSWRMHVTLHCENGRIAWMEEGKDPAAESFSYLTPGLVDNHIHGGNCHTSGTFHLLDDLTLDFHCNCGNHGTVKQIDLDYDLEFIFTIFDDLDRTGVAAHDPDKVFHDRAASKTRHAFHAQHGTADQRSQHVVMDLDQTQFRRSITGNGSTVVGNCGCTVGRFGVFHRVTSWS